jgi:hypothetical protein
MRIFLTIIVLGSLWFSISLGENLGNSLEKLSNLYNQGSISKEEFDKAKTILLKIEENNKKKIKSKKVKQKQKIIIQHFNNSISKKNFEKMEMFIGDYRIYTFRPGGIKIRRISDNMQLAVIGDTGKIKYYNNSDKLFELLNPSTNKTIYKLNNVPILVSETRYIEKHRATFYQIMALGTKPFHYFIRLKNNNNVIGLNYDSFEKKIQKAMEKAKVRLASVHNVSIEQINSLMKKREAKALAELEKIIGKEKDEFLSQQIENVISAELQRQLDEALGASLAAEFVSAIESAFNVAIEESLEAELAAELNAVIAEAISSGISEAAISAGIQAYLDAIAAGASEADAYAAGEEACGC